MGHLKISKTRAQARKLRDLAYEVAVRIASAEQLDDSMKEQCKLLDIAIRAWETAAERERIASGLPLPGSMKPEMPKKPRPLPLIAGVTAQAGIIDEMGKDSKH